MDVGFQFICSGSRRSGPDTLCTVTTYGPSLGVFPSPSLPSKPDDLFPGDLQCALSLVNRQIVESQTLFLTFATNRTCSISLNPPTAQRSQQHFVWLQPEGALRQRNYRNDNNLTWLVSCRWCSGGSLDLVKTNGDIEDFREATGTTSVMLARAAMWNVSIFSKRGPFPVEKVMEEYLKYVGLFLMLILNFLIF